MSKVDDNKKIKKESLLNSALELFTTKGMEETSISDIAKRSGVAKGTFYLYFNDKINIRNVLISRESSRLFLSAFDAMDKAGISGDFADELIFIINHIIDELATNTLLLRFISKNLSWGIFREIVLTDYTEDNPGYARVYETLVHNPANKFQDTEIMLFMIIELVNCTCYATLLYETPFSLEDIKPYLFQTIRDIVEKHRV